MNDKNIIGKGWIRQCKVWMDRQGIKMKLKKKIDGKKNKLGVEKLLVERSH